MMPSEQRNHRGVAEEISHPRLLTSWARTRANLPACSAHIHTKASGGAQNVQKSVFEARSAWRSLRSHWS
jgi:hypothetical protein